MEMQFQRAALRWWGTLLLLASFCVSLAAGFTACVTGAAGLVGSEIVKQLLERGHYVRGTVRSLVDADRLAHLRALAEEYPGQLRLLGAELLEPGSFNQPVQGCDYVFHSAGPFYRNFEDAEEEIVRPILEGTENVLGSVRRHDLGSIKKVIITSSTAAVRGAGSKPSNGQYFTEEDWNQASKRDGPRMEPYQWAKTNAERKALAFMEESGIPVATICPSTVLGPPLCVSTRSSSLGFMRSWLSGQPVLECRLLADVRDVARAHIMVAEASGATGRYIVSSERRIAPPRVGDILRKGLPQLADVIPEVPVAMGKSEQGQQTPAAPFDIAAEKPLELSSERIRSEIGLVLTPVEKTLLDTANALLSKPVPSAAVPATSGSAV